MNPDWNWFFSSIAQSAAAIVGIMFAFIITKTLSGKQAFAERLGKVKNLFIRANALKTMAGRRLFDWYNEQCEISAIDDLTRRYEDSDGNLPFYDCEKIYEALDFSPYQPIEDAISAIKSRLEELDSIREKINDGVSVGSEQVDSHSVGRESIFNTMLPSLDGGLRSVFENGLHGSLGSYIGYPEQRFLNWESIGKERDKIERLTLEIQQHSERARILLGELESSPEYSKEIEFSIYLVSVLFYFGVIWPLSFLPLSTGEKFTVSFSAILPAITSFQGLMLSIFGIAFAFIPVFFFRLNRSFKYSEEEISRLKMVTRLGYYSKHYKIYEENSLRSASVGANHS